MTTRWNKIWRDLWGNRARTILVILSISVGVFAIGMITATRKALTESLAAQFTALQPADAILITDPLLDEDFVSGIRHMRDITEAEGRRSIALRLSPDGQGDTWRDITLYAIPEFDDQRLFHVWPQEGKWPPEKGEVLLNVPQWNIWACNLAIRFWSRPVQAVRCICTSAARCMICIVSRL
jgi:putative ABC transport system permease protein